MTTTAIEKPPRPPTDRMMEIYRFVFERTMRDGFQPSFREIADAFGFSSQTAVVYPFYVLARKGWIELPDGKSRNIRFLRCPDGSPFLGFTPIKGGGQ